ncbi:MAG: helix-turn-helix transcriptional regulator [Ruminococcaceae bacterium]|nr:helix-turn-helix transcriptional regulator [Oscillospiraceae bacterium]
MNNYDFGNYICELREKKGLTQKELGERLGVTNKAVSRWENGGAYPSTELMLPLAKELGVTIEDLYKAVSVDKTPKTKLRRFLEWLMHRSKIIAVVCMSWWALQYVLYLCFSNAPDKWIVAGMTPIMSSIFFVMFYFSFILFKKNPFAPEKMINFIIVFFLAFVSLSAFLMLKDFIFYFPNGFYMTSSMPPVAITAIVLALKKILR